MDYKAVAEAIDLPGLRIAFTQGSPGPWGMAARTFFEIKGVPFTPVAQIAGETNDALQAWTGQSSAPVAILDNERPRSNWAEILLLAERLAPEPRLIPDNERERMEMFGLCHEICAEDGLGWNIRLLLFDVMERSGAPMSEHLKNKFRSDAPLERAAMRVNSIIGAFRDRLVAQHAQGSSYLVGQALTAADIYWTAFSTLLSSLSPTVCTLPDFYRGLDAACCAYLDEPVPPILLEHRDRILENHFKLPMWF